MAFWRKLLVNIAMFVLTSDKFQEYLNQNEIWQAINEDVKNMLDRLERVDCTKICSLGDCECEDL
jgi:hypothetical protein|tara:strand:+ start:311 stop:505 length:195 start_codon:yes stop_codon:yes gene_type:complete